MRKKTLSILCAVLGVVIIAVVGILSRTSLLEKILEPTPINKGAQPDELLQQYFAFIAIGQYEDMYEMLTTQSQAMISKEDFVATNKSIYGGIEAKNIAITIGQISDDVGSASEGEAESMRKVVEYSLRMDTSAGEISFAYSALFALNEDKEYRMQWSTHTIFPNLNPEDKVRVNTLTARRGCIYDRVGEMLAGPGVASAIGFVPGKMRKAEETVPQSTSDSVENTELPVVSDDSASIKAPDSIYNVEDIAKVAELLETTPENIVKKLNATYVKDKGTSNN